MGSSPVCFSGPCPCVQPRPVWWQLSRHPPTATRSHIQSTTVRTSRCAWVGTGVGRPVTWRPLRWTGFPVPRDVREEADTGRRGGRRIARTTERILLLLEYKKRKIFWTLDSTSCANSQVTRQKRPDSPRDESRDEERGARNRKKIP